MQGIWASEMGMSSMAILRWQFSASIQAVCILLATTPAQQFDGTTRQNPAIVLFMTYSFSSPSGVFDNQDAADLEYQETAFWHIFETSTQNASCLVPL